MLLLGIREVNRGLGECRREWGDVLRGGIVGLRFGGILLGKIDGVEGIYLRMD